MIKKWRYLSGLIGILFISGSLHAMHQDQYPFDSPADTVRFQELTKTIRCVVCQNQNIADSNAPLASDLRQKIYYMILDKQSNTAIQNYLIKRYGEYILLKPRFDTLTAFLWLFPFVITAVILFALRRIFK